MLDTIPFSHGGSSPTGRDCQETTTKKTTTLGSLWEGGEKSGWNCSRRKEGAHREERFSIFNWVVGVGFVVKQRLSEDLKEVWEYEETSVAGAEWVKKRAAVQGLRADRY